MLNTALLKSKQIPLEFQFNPKKFKKYHKIKYKTSKSNCSLLNDKVAALFFTTNHKSLTLKQLLTILKLLKSNLKNHRLSRVSLKIKFDSIITKKPKDTRMGRGKGAPSERVFNLQAGKNVFSLYMLPSMEADRILNICAKKLPYINIINNYKW